MRTSISKRIDRAANPGRSVVEDMRAGLRSCSYMPLPRCHAFPAMATLPSADEFPTPSPARVDYTEVLAAATCLIPPRVMQFVSTFDDLMHGTIHSSPEGPPPTSRVRPASRAFCLAYPRQLEGWLVQWSLRRQVEK